MLLLLPVLLTLALLGVASFQFCAGYADRELVLECTQRGLLLQVGPAGCGAYAALRGARSMQRATSGVACRSACPGVYGRSSEILQGWPWCCRWRTPRHSLTGCLNMAWTAAAQLRHSGVPRKHRATPTTSPAVAAARQQAGSAPEVQHTCTRQDCRAACCIVAAPPWPPFAPCPLPPTRRTSDNRVCVLAIPKAEPGEHWCRLFRGDSHGARCMRPPYTLSGAGGRLAGRCLVGGCGAVPATATECCLIGAAHGVPWLFIHVPPAIFTLDTLSCIYVARRNGERCDNGGRAALLD